MRPARKRLTTRARARLMETVMKTQPPAAPPALDLSVGRMIITWEEGAPRVEFDPVGKISQGWFDRHTNVFQRAIQRAQVAQRNLARQGVE